MVALHQGHGARAVKPTDENLEITTRADVLRLGRDFKGEGIPVRIIEQNGLMIGAVAAGLRADGYSVEVKGREGDRTLHITGNPGSNSRALKSRWERLFEVPSARPE